MEGHSITQDMLPRHSMKSKVEWNLGPWGRGPKCFHSHKLHALQFIKHFPIRDLPIPGRQAFLYSTNIYQQPSGVVLRAKWPLYIKDLESHWALESQQCTLVVWDSGEGGVVPLLLSA